MNSKLKQLVIALAATTALAYASVSCATDITGAGATFPAPAYAKWGQEYESKTGVKVNYQSMGSGAGIKQIIAKTVDFGASDKPLTVDELNKNGLMQFPTLVGGVVPVINVAGIENGKLKLDGATLANIFLGKITKWNDPAIAALNKGLTLPATVINTVTRADGSGTTFIFTNYLSKVSAVKASATAEAISFGDSYKGNEGVANGVKTQPNSIGYVEYAYAKQTKMNAVQMKNHDGNFVAANEVSFKAAAAGAKWDKAPGFYEILTDEAGKNAWPISGATFILVQKNQDKPASGLAVLSYFDWAYANGDKMATDLDYVTLPDDVVKLVRAAWKAQIKDGQGKAIWTK